MAFSSLFSSYADLLGSSSDLLCSREESSAFQMGLKRAPLDPATVELSSVPETRGLPNTYDKIVITVIASPKGAAISFLLGIASSLRFSQ
jgi:hypothetical protein